MLKWFGAAVLVGGLMLAGCQSGGGDADAANEAVARNDAPAEANAAGERMAALGGCPFRSTTGWGASIDGERLEVNGRVDLMMAGMRPALTPRPGAAQGTLALDLALAPDPQAAVEDHVHYERAGTPAYRRAEIWCGGERIAAMDVIRID